MNYGFITNGIVISVLCRRLPTYTFNMNFDNKRMQNGHTVDSTYTKNTDRHKPYQLVSHRLALGDIVTNNDSRINDV